MGNGLTWVRDSELDNAAALPHLPCKVPYACPCLSCQHITASCLPRTCACLADAETACSCLLLLDAGLLLAARCSVWYPQLDLFELSSVGPGCRMNDSGRVAAALGLTQCHARHRSGSPATDTAISPFLLHLRSSSTRGWGGTTVPVQVEYGAPGRVSMYNAVEAHRTRSAGSSRQRKLLSPNKHPARRTAASDTPGATTTSDHGFRYHTTHAPQADANFDPNTTPSSMPPFDLPGLPGLRGVCIDTLPARSDDGRSTLYMVISRRMHNILKSQVGSVPLGCSTKACALSAILLYLPDLCKDVVAIWAKLAYGGQMLPRAMHMYSVLHTYVRPCASVWWPIRMCSLPLCLLARSTASLICLLSCFAFHP